MTIKLQNTGFLGYWNWKIMDGDTCVAASSAMGEEQAKLEAYAALPAGQPLYAETSIPLSQVMNPSIP